MPSLSLKFLDADLAAQEEAAQKARELAKGLADKMADAVKAGGGKVDLTSEELANLRNVLLKISDDLISNATSTATSSIDLANFISKSST